MMCQLGRIREAVQPRVRDRLQGFSLTQLWDLVTSLWKAVASASNGSEAATDQQSRTPRRNAGCDVGESEAKVEPPKTNGTPICLLPLLTLTVKHKAGALFHRPGPRFVQDQSSRKRRAGGGVATPTGRASRWVAARLVTQPLQPHTAFHSTRADASFPPPNHSTDTCCGRP